MLKFKNKIWWREDDGRLFIHPFVAIPFILIITGLVIWGLEMII
jgi:hypothetical protein